jgi:hypothetical protein
MKMFVLPFLLVCSPNVFASTSCTSQNTQFVCDSTTTVGNTTIFINPRLHTDAGDAYVITATSGGDTPRTGETGLCKAMGLSSSVDTQYGDANFLANAYVVIFNDSDGSIQSFSLFPAEAVPTAGYSPISVITCRN